MIMFFGILNNVKLCGEQLEQGLSAFRGETFFSKVDRRDRDGFNAF